MRPFPGDARGFQPGFRMDRIDGAFILLMTGVAAGTYRFSGWLSLAVVTTVVHFFLFCNVFRIQRSLELIWAGTFVSMASATSLAQIPGWPVTYGLTLSVTLAVIGRGITRPSYHGVGWRILNPQLPTWWQRQGHG